MKITLLAVAALALAVVAVVAGPWLLWTAIGPWAIVIWAGMYVAAIGFGIALGRTSATADEHGQELSRVWAKDQGQ